MATRIQVKSQAVALAKQLMAGAQKHLTSTTQVPLLGMSLSPTEIATKLQSIVTLRADVDAAKAATKAKLAVESADTPSLHALMGAFVTYLKAAYGHSPDALADFGINPKARAPLTVEAKTAAAAKRTATRAARHTMGKQQKKGIKGDVTGILVTPTTAAAPTAPAPAGPTPPATSGAASAAPTPHTA